MRRTSPGSPSPFESCFWTGVPLVQIEHRDEPLGEPATTRRPSPNAAAPHARPAGTSKIRSKETRCSGPTSAARVHQVSTS